MKDKAKITFNNSIYFPAVLEKAVSDFKQSCKIKFVNEGIFSFVVLESREELEYLTYEFCNYLLALMKDKLVSLAHYVKKEEKDAL